MRQTREAIRQGFVRMRPGAHLTPVGRRADHGIDAVRKPPGLHGVGLLDDHLACEQASLLG